MAVDGGEGAAAGERQPGPADSTASAAAMRVSGQDTPVSEASSSVELTTTVEGEQEEAGSMATEAAQPEERAGAAAMEELYRWRGKEPPVDRISVEMAEHYWWFDSTKAERELGFSARDPQLTLAETVKYLRQGLDA